MLSMLAEMPPFHAYLCLIHHPRREVEGVTGDTTESRLYIRSFEFIGDTGPLYAAGAGGAFVFSLRPFALAICGGVLGNG